MTKIRSIAATFVAAAAIGLAAPAHADKQFATFDGGSTQFHFVNFGSGSLFVANGPVTFHFDEDVSNGSITYGKGDAISATVSETASAAGPAISGGGFLAQPLTGVSFDFRDSSNNLLLHVTSDSAAIVKLTSSTGDVVSDSLDGANLIYTSDFLTFTPDPINGGGSFGEPLTLTTFSKNANGYLNTLTASGSGAFTEYGSIASVPEASSVVSFGCLMLFGGAFMLRRRSVSGANRIA